MTPLQPGIPIIAAPRFHIDSDWPKRLSINSGIAIDGDQFYPRDDWRTPTQAELDFLTKDGNNHSGSILLFNLTDRLHSQWWSLAESLGESGPESVAFQMFAKDILDYLLFKKLPLLPETLFEVILTAPGQLSVRPNAAGLLREWSDTKMLAGINLSDEEAAVVYLNLRENVESDSSSVTMNEDRSAFLQKHRNYPLTRLMLRPREGYWLPRTPIIMDRDTLNRSEIDVHLAIKPCLATPVTYSQGAPG